VDNYWMMAFGILGYFMKMYGFQVAPIILGVILGPLMDVSYRRAMISARDSVWTFLIEFLTSPLSLVLTIALALLLLSQTPLGAMVRARMSRTGGAA
jgi:putative tricarboxylic transport membrane protein